ncbi:MAG: hypothetical protein GY796_09630 [Chloroflexi bacterium]|nr:hypothetical protein [Chloroflexota bacterium]
MNEAREEELKFQYYVASFFCFNACALWHHMGEEGLLIYTGKLTDETPSPDYLASIISELAFDSIVRFPSQKFEGRKRAIQEKFGELAYEWLFRLESEAKLWVEDHICDRFLFNVTYLYFAFLAQVTRQLYNVLSEITSQLKTIEVHRATHMKLLETADKIDSDLAFVESELDIEKEMVNLLNHRRIQFSDELATVWRQSFDLALAC